MLRDIQQETVIREILSQERLYALYGMSSNPIRPSYFVGTYLNGHAFNFVSINPGIKEIFSRPCYPRISDMPSTPDVVVIFRRAEECPGVVREAIAAGAKWIWLQFGIVSEESRKLAAEAGIGYVEDRCLKVEHSRYLGNLYQAGINTGLISARRRHSSTREDGGISMAPLCEFPSRN